tara:strand:- start:458 stop:2125 length:1668 start_codon:yes stop_codon:yes gene_type:complete
MSKTLFNQNTFQSKNVTNSDDVQDLKVDTFKAINLTATNITNAELQAATSGVAANLASLANKQNTLSATELLNPNFIDAEDDGDSVIITKTEFGSLTGFDNDSGTIQDQIDSKPSDYDVEAPLVKTTRALPVFPENPILLSIDNTSSITDGSTDLITSGGVFTGLATKQATLSTGDGIDITGTTISFDGVMSGSIVTSGTITGATLNYVSSGVVTSVQTEIESKQDTITSADNAGLGVAISGSGLISLDLSTLTATQTLPTALEIVSNSDTQLLITATADTSQDAKLILRGRRNGSTSNNHAEISFENYDQDLTGAKTLGSIVGRVSDAGNNYGGLLFNNFADGATQTTAMTMSSNGNFIIGAGDVFQDNYTFRNNGSSKLTGLNYILPQLRLLSYDKDDIFGSNWGNGSTQTNITTDREIGESFSTDNGLGLIELTKNGYYRIRVAANTQSDGYNDRIGFMNYLRIVTSTTTTDYSSVNSKNFFGWGYTRNNTDGGHQSVTFEDYIYLESGDSIQVRHKLETTGDRNFNNTLPAANIDNYLNVQIERIYDTNPE